MAKVVWDRETDIRNARSIIPFKESPSRENFKPPTRIHSDFERLLQHDVPNVNWTFELIHNWYYVNTQTDESIEKLTQRELQRMYDGGCRIIRVHKEWDGDETENVYYALEKDGTYAETTDYATDIH